MRRSENQSPLDASQNVNADAAQASVAQPVERPQAGEQTLAQLARGDWMGAIDAYFQELAEALDRVNYSAAMFAEQTEAGYFGALEESSRYLLTATQDLERLLAVRTDILMAATKDGETRPRSLRAALQRAADPQRAELAEQLAKQVEESRQKALTMFVTQFHLFETSDEILRRLLRQGPEIGSYGKRHKPAGGGLLDDAA